MDVSSDSSELVNAWLLASIVKVAFWLVRLLPVRVAGALGQGLGV